MPTCPKCSAAYDAGLLECPACGAALIQETEPREDDAVDLDETGARGADDVEWTPVHTASGLSLRAVEDDLESRGITFVRLPAENIAAMEVGVFGTQELALYTLAVPADQYALRRAEIEAAIAAMQASSLGDPALQAEAEEDYDVRGCPSCRRYYHGSYAECPGTGEPLLPAVECFEVDQTEPERVVVVSGAPAEMGRLAARLTAAGFNPSVETPEGWPVALVELSWDELTARTAEAQAALGG